MGCYPSWHLIHIHNKLIFGSNWTWDQMPLFHIQGYTSFRYKGSNSNWSFTSLNIEMLILPWGETFIFKEICLSSNKWKETVKIKIKTVSRLNLNLQMLLPILHVCILLCVTFKLVSTYLLLDELPWIIGLCWYFIQHSSDVHIVIVYLIQSHQKI